MTTDHDALDRMSEDGLAVFAAAMRERPFGAEPGGSTLRAVAIDPIQAGGIPRLVDALLWLGGATAALASYLGERLGLTDDDVVQLLVDCELAAREVRRAVDPDAGL